MNGYYQVSNLGRVRSLTRKVNTFGGTRTLKGQLLKPFLSQTGYYRVNLKKHPINIFVFIHKLVASAFIANPYNYSIVNHKDSNPLNNVVSNLEWCTQSYNVKYGYTYGNAKPTTGCFKKGNIPHNSKKVSQYDKNGNFIKTYSSIKLASKSINVSYYKMRKCFNNNFFECGSYIWKYTE